MGTEKSEQRGNRGAGSAGEGPAMRKGPARRQGAKGLGRWTVISVRGQGASHPGAWTSVAGDREVTGLLGFSVTEPLPFEEQEQTLVVV